MYEDALINSKPQAVICLQKQLAWAHDLHQSFAGDAKHEAAHLKLDVKTSTSP